MKLIGNVKNMVLRQSEGLISVPTGRFVAVASLSHSNNRWTISLLPEVFLYKMFLIKLIKVEDSYFLQIISLFVELDS